MHNRHTAGCILSFPPSVGNLDARGTCSPRKRCKRTTRTSHSRPFVSDGGITRTRISTQNRRTAGCILSFAPSIGNLDAHGTRALLKRGGPTTRTSHCRAFVSNGGIPGPRTSTKNDHATACILNLAPSNPSQAALGPGSLPHLRG